MNKSCSILTSIVATGLMTSAIAAPGADKPQGPAFYGNIDALPPGRLKHRIEKLPFAAQQQALRWLDLFNIPGEDYDFLNADSDGMLYYIETVVPDFTVTATSQTDPTSASINPADTFTLHSRPGASKVVFLDFDGHTISNTAWNSNGGLPVYYARAYNTEGSDTDFSEKERNDIAEIWHRVAEDLAPFDIDVTTEQPASFGPQVGHVLITSRTDDNGNSMPHSNAGGVAYVGVWGRSYYTNYQPALVYYDNLGNGHPPYVAEASSHEFGHNLSLSHDGATGTSYYDGHGSGSVSWAPIMGVGYYSNVTQWNNGDYSGANNNEDDITIISNQLGYRRDDHGNSISNATALNVESDGGISATNPETDPFNTVISNKGVIETAADSDLFWFDTAAGNVSFTITPAWDAFYRSSLRGANLNIEATLYDQSGNALLISNPATETHAQLSASLSAGRYYLGVTGVGNSNVPFSDYGSLGMYFISGSIQPQSAGDTTAPTPGVMSWQSPPAAGSRTSISMTSVVAEDDSGIVQYRFECTAATGSGCSVSDWQASNQFTADNLSPGSSYSYRVIARDAAGNQNTASATASAVTDSNAVPAANDDIASVNQGSNVSVAVLNNDTDTDNDPLTVTGYGAALNGSVTQQGNNLIYTPDSGFSGTDSFSYSISDGFDNAQGQVTVTVLDINDAPVANDDTASVATNSSVVINVLANDTDADGDTLRITGVSSPNKGSVSYTDTEITFTSESKRGGASFTYSITDGNGGSASATVSVSISRNGGGDSGGDDGGGGNTKCHPKRGC
jgi:hypothetical protein